MSRRLTKLDLAEYAITGQIWAWLDAFAGREDDPDSFPGYPDDLSPGAVARRVLGELLDLGWTAPS